MWLDKLKEYKEKLILYGIVVAMLVVFIILIMPSKKANNNHINVKQNTINLVGDNPYYLLKGKDYNEPGYLAYDAKGNNISYSVEKIGVVNPEVAGEYQITYKAGETTAVRKVIVVNLEAKFVEESNEYTNESYNIMLVIKGTDYVKTMLPDKTYSNSRGIEYAVNENNTYKFVIFDKYNNATTLERRISNLDHTAPIGSCTNKLDLGKTYVTVEATDGESGLASYGYNNGKDTITSTKNTYTYSGLYKEVSVILKDKVGNKATIKCVSSGEGALPPKDFPTTAHKMADSDTLKVAIEKKSGYFLTRIWVLDPYTQINKGLILENWNKKRSYAIDILNYEISSKNLTDKIVLGINGSGFYENGTWTPGCSSKYLNQYNRTTEGPLVIYDGKVVRNWYEDGALDKSRPHSIYTVSKEGYLDVYQGFNGLSETDRKNLFDSIVSKGYRNTWTFRPVAILNGNILTTDLVGTQSKNRNVVCQIDRNNWAILTGETTAEDAVNILKNLGCQTAVNMDGSSSVSLHFKSKDGTLERIHGGSRDVVDTLYFTELQ